MITISDKMCRLQLIRIVIGIIAISNCNWEYYVIVIENIIMSEVNYYNTGTHTHNISTCTFHVIWLTCTQSQLYVRSNNS